MVHKKYTYKDGKRFGPYYYETKRVDGKIVTTYLGSEPPKIKRENGFRHFNYLMLASVFLILIIGFYFVFPEPYKFIGKVISENIGDNETISEGGIVEEIIGGDGLNDSAEIIDNTEGEIIDTDAGNFRLEDNETDLIETDGVIFDSDVDADVKQIEVNVTKVQYTAVIGKPVKWAKKVQLSDTANVTIEIPASAVNVFVNETKSLKSKNETEDKLKIKDKENNKTMKESNLTDGNVTIEIETNFTDELDDNESAGFEVGENESEEELINESEEVIEGVGEETSADGGDLASEEDVGGEVSETEDGTEEEIESEIAAEEAPENNEITIDINGNVIYGAEGRDNFFVSFFKKFLSIMGFVVVEEDSDDVSVVEVENVQEVEVSYETPAPYVEETVLENGKEVKVVGPDDVHYEDVLVFTDLNKDLEITSGDKIKIYWVENDTFLDIYEINDTDLNGIYDYVSWVAPMLSNQTFNIIVITRAEHLDSNRTFISDIYDDVKELDGNWSETIPDGDYVRVVFERNLTSENDITIYLKAVNGTNISDVLIDVYGINKNETIVQFANIIENEYNKVYLTDLVGEQGVFDLLVVGGSVEFEHIIDPSSQPGSGENGVVWSGAISETTAYTFSTGATVSAGCAANLNSTNSIGCLEDEGSGSLDAYFVWNVSIPEFVTIESINLTTTATTVGGTEPINISFYNFTSAKWVSFTSEKTPSAAGVNVTLNYNITANGTGLVHGLDKKVLFMVRTRGGNARDLMVDLMEAKIAYTAPAAGGPPDTSAPNVTLINPSNNSVTPTGITWFGALFVDDVNVSNATFYLYNSTNKLVAMNFTGLGNKTIFKNITHNIGLNGTGAYYWNFLAVDNKSAPPNQAFNNSNFTISYNILDTLAPNISLLSPPNGSTTGNSNNYFAAHILDNVNASNATLYVWNSTNNLIGTNFTGVGNSSRMINISYNLNYSGTFYWNFLVFDNASAPNSAFNNTNFTLVYNSDTTAPLVTIVSPLNQTYNTSLINFNATLNENGDTIIYSLDSGLNNATLTKHNNTNFGHINTSIGSGFYNVNFYANDTIGNKNYTTSTTFTIDLVNASVNATILNSSSNLVNATVEFYDKDSYEYRYNSTSNYHYPRIERGKKYKIKLKPLNQSISEIIFDDYNLTDDITGRILDLDELGNFSNFDNGFAVNTIIANFNNATVTFNATSDSLYKCPSWNFASQTCTNGEWFEILNGMIPGQLYNITIAPGDPGYGQINITNATHLNENYSFISNIYEQVKTLDDVWSERINHSHYVRVTFEKNLTSINDITLYPNNSAGKSTSVWVYYENSSNKIAEFPLLNATQYYSVVLSNLVGSYNTFDLKVVNWDNDTSAFLEFDHIIDPNTAPAVSNVTLQSTTRNNETTENLTLTYNNSDVNGNVVYNVTDWRLWNVTQFDSLFVLNMPLDSNDSATTTDLIRDYSTWMNNGTLGAGGSTEVPIYNSTACAIGGCYDFDGVNDRVVVDDHWSVNVTGNLTLMAWIKFAHMGQKSTFPYILSKENSVSTKRVGYGIQFGNTSKKITCENWLDNSNKNVQSAKADWVKDQWYHITCTYDRNGGTNNYKLYVNGVLDAQATQDFNVGNNTFQITLGERTSNGGNNFWGSIDDVYVSRNILTIDEIKWFAFNKTSTGLHSDRTTLNDIWQACVTPNDLIDDGKTECSRNLTIIDFNYAPSVSNVVLNATKGTNLTTENLSVDFDATDSDGDTVYNSTDWRLWNGTGFESIAVLNMPFDVNYSNQSFYNNNSIYYLIRDYSSWGNNGSLVNFTQSLTANWTQINWTAQGIKGGAYSFDGADDYIDAGSSKSLDLRGDFSILFWINLTSDPAADRYILAKQVTSVTGAGYHVRFVAATNKIRMFVGDGTDNKALSTNSTLSVGPWAQVAFTFNNSNDDIRAYFNGSFEVNATGSNIDVGNIAANLSIGVDGLTFSGTYLPGILDEILIVNRTLTPEQISSIYNETLQTKYWKTLVREETKKNQNWSVCVTPNDLKIDGATTCSNSLIINNSLPNVTLLSPENGNITTNRTPVFSWSGSDDDGDSLTYEMNITLTALSTCSEQSRHITSISSTSHIPTSELRCIIDNGDYYNWTVRATDGNFGPWASPTRNISIQSLVSVSLPNSTVEFGSIADLQTNDTSDNSPRPFLIQNDGNVPLNVTINASNLWVTQTNPSTSYQFKTANNTLENGSFNWAQSITTYTNMPISPTLCVARLNYTDATDTAEIDINITVPTDEGAGLKRSYVSYVASYAGG